MAVLPKNNNFNINLSATKTDIDKQIDDIILSSAKDVDFLVEVLFDRIITMFNKNEMDIEYSGNTCTFNFSTKVKTTAEAYSFNIGKNRVKLLHHLDDDDKLELICNDGKNEIKIVSSYKKLDDCEGTEYIPRMFHYLKAFNIINENVKKKEMLNKILTNK